MENKTIQQRDQERARACSLLADEFNKDRLVLFIGSGCSRAAGLPTWKELIDKLMDKNRIKSNEKDLITLASIIESKIGKENFREQIVEKLKTNPKEKSSLHEKIVSLGLNLHITTNYDHILEDSFRLQGIDPHVITQGKDIPTINPTQKIIVKLHGDINSPSSLILTSDDYRKYNFTQKQFIEWLNAKFAEKTILFLGTSFEDPRLRRTEEHVFSLFKDLRRGHYILLKKPASTDAVVQEDFEYICNDFKAKGFHVLLIDSYNDVEEILDLIRTKFATQEQDSKALSGTAVLLRDDYANSLEKELKDHIDDEVLRLTEEVRGNGSPLIPAEKIKRAAKLLNYIEVNLVKLSDESKLEGYLVVADAFCDVKYNDISKSKEIFDKANAVFQKVADKIKWEERLSRTRAKILFFEGKVEEAIASLSDFNEDKTMAFKLAILIDSNQIDKAYDFIKSKEIKIAWVSEALYILIRAGEIDEAEATFAKIIDKFNKAKREARLTDSDFKNVYFSDSICYAMASGFLSRMFFITGKKEGEILTFADINEECLKYCMKCLEYLDRLFDFTESQSLNSHLVCRARLAEMMASELIGDLARANKAAEALLQYKPMKKDLIAYVLRRGKCWKQQDIVSIARRILEDYPKSFYGFYNAAMIELSLLEDKDKAWYLFKEAIAYAVTGEDFKRLVLSAISVGFTTGHLKEAVSAVADILPPEDIYKDFLFAEYADCEGDDTVEIKYAEIETKNPPAEILATVKFRLALIAQKRSEFDKAKALLEESNRLVFNLETLKCLLHVLTLLQDDRGALTIAEQIESLDPTDWGAIHIKAQTARNLNFYKKSQNAFSTLVEKFPEKPEYAYGLAHILMLQFKYAEGLDVLKKFINEDGFFNVNCLQLAANIYATRNETNDLVAAFNLLDKFYDKIIDNYTMLLMHMDFAYRTDNDAIASKSIQRMKELKAEGKVPDNVFREVPFEDLKRIISETHEAKEKSNSDYLQGKLPRLLLSEARNTPAYLDWALRTQELVLPNDLKLWVDFTVYATNGLGVLPITPSLHKFVPIVAPNNDEIIIDLQALITIHRLGLLDELGERYKKVYYPANLLKILKYQEDKFHFPQKSRENVLRKLVRKLDVGTIKTAKRNLSMILRHLPFEFSVLFRCSLAPDSAC